jgi:hypothetical protein
VWKSCNILGHSADQCRIFDAETMKENGGRKSLFWFDIVKEPRDYQDQLIAHLKAYGPIQGPTAHEFIDKRLEETRTRWDTEQAEKAVDPDGYK